MKQDKAVFGTKEWASSTVNIQVGCEHGCKYCYAKSKYETTRKTPNQLQRAIVKQWYGDKKFSWEKPVKKDLKNIGKRTGIIMFPSTHDITPDNLDQVLVMLIRMLFKDNQVLIVSKPHLDCIKQICAVSAAYKKQLLFRFTIGSANDKVLKFWEPDAPTFKERLASLKYAFEAGFKTSVSSEPMLDTEIHKVVEAVEPFITDSIWIGKMNFAEKRVRDNGFNDKETLQRVQELDEWQNDDANIWAIYNKFKKNSKIKWKESIKKVVGITVPTQAGLDVTWQQILQLMLLFKSMEEL